MSVESQVEFDDGDVSNTVQPNELYVAAQQQESDEFANEKKYVKRLPCKQGSSCYARWPDNGKYYWGTINKVPRKGSRTYYSVRIGRLYR